MCRVAQVLRGCLEPLLGQTTSPALPFKFSMSWPSRRVAISAFRNTAKEGFRTAALKWQQRKCCCCTSDSWGQLSQQSQIHWARCEQSLGQKWSASGWPLFAMLAASGLTTWRSHHLYPNAQVQVSDVTNVLKVANEIDPQVSDLTSAVASRVHRSLTSGLRGCQFYCICTYAFGEILVNSQPRVPNETRDPQDTHAFSDVICYFPSAAIGHPGGKLWHRLASDELPSLQPIWPRISKWLLQAPEGTPPVVFMTMLWGSMGNQTWAARFLDRAMVVGIPRFIFISPDGSLLEDCEEEFLTLTGWAGSTADISQAMLLHLTRTTPIEGPEKRSTFFTLLDATLTSTSREHDLQAHVQIAASPALRQLLQTYPEWRVLVRMTGGNEVRR
eukprot:s55_g39.t1